MTSPIPAFTVRLLDEDDAEEFVRLGQEAFGVPTQPSSSAPAASPYRPGSRAYGAVAEVAGKQVLLGRLVHRDYESFFGSAAIPTCGVAGVTVGTEFRGGG